MYHGYNISYVGTLNMVVTCPFPGAVSTCICTAGKSDFGLTPATKSHVPYYVNRLYSHHNHVPHGNKAQNPIYRRNKPLFLDSATRGFTFCKDLRVVRQYKHLHSCLDGLQHNKIMPKVVMPMLVGQGLEIETVLGSRRLHVFVSDCLYIY